MSFTVKPVRDQSNIADADNAHAAAEAVTRFQERHKGAVKIEIHREEDLPKRDEEDPCQHKPQT